MVKTTFEYTPPDSSGYHLFKEFSPGWGGSGFHHSTAEVKTRRVIQSDGKEEIQISFATHTVKGISKRIYSSYGSVTVPKEFIEMLIKSVTDVKQ